MRHLKTLGVGPSDLIPPISTNITALMDCPIRYRSLAFPSAADLFDVQSSFNHMIVNNIQLNKFVELTLNEGAYLAYPTGLLMIGSCLSVNPRRALMLLVS